MIAYKVSPLTYILGRMLITGVDFIGMPNILAGRRIVPELIQGEVTAEKLVRAAEPLLSDTIRAETVAALGACASGSDAGRGGTGGGDRAGDDPDDHEAAHPIAWRLFGYLRRYLFPVPAVAGRGDGIAGGGQRRNPVYYQAFVDLVTI